MTRVRVRRVAGFGLFFIALMNLLTACSEDTGWVVTICGIPLIPTGEGGGGFLLAIIVFIVLIGLGALINNR